METANSSLDAPAAEALPLERLRIDRMGHRGDGIAETPEGPVYVPYALAGETVEVERTAERARLIQVIERSPERINPVCRHFGTCGGCAVQHWRSARYRAWKRELAVTALAQAGVEAPVEDMIDAHGEGRRRAVLHARRGAKNAAVVGFTGRRSHMVVPIERCPILAPALKRALPVARRLAAALELSGRPLDLHFTATDGGLDVDIRGSGALGPETIAALAAIAREERLARVTRHGEVVAKLAEPSIRFGRAAVVLPPGAFLQATVAGEEALAGLVQEAIGETRRVADLFCGVGTFALRLAETARMLAVDSDAAATAALARAAGALGLKPVEAKTRDLFRHPLTAGELVPCRAAVLDPPRQGAEAQVRELANASLSRIVYVSCDPATFARDAKILIDGGYRLGRVVPVDQFRYSAHIELVGVFDR